MLILLLLGLVGVLGLPMDTRIEVLERRIEAQGRRIEALERLLGGDDLHKSTLVFSSNPAPVTVSELMTSLGTLNVFPESIVSFAVHSTGVVLLTHVPGATLVRVWDGIEPLPAPRVLPRPYGPSCVCVASTSLYGIGYTNGQVEIYSSGTGRLIQVITKPYSVMNSYIPASLLYENGIGGDRVEQLSFYGGSRARYIIVRYRDGYLGVFSIATGQLISTQDYGMTRANWFAQDKQRQLVLLYDFHITLHRAVHGNSLPIARSCAIPLPLLSPGETLTSGVYHSSTSLVLYLATTSGNILVVSTKDLWDSQIQTQETCAVTSVIPGNSSMSLARTKDYLLVTRGTTLQVYNVTAKSQRLNPGRVARMDIGQGDSVKGTGRIVAVAGKHTFQLYSTGEDLPVFPSLTRWPM